MNIYLNMPEKNRLLSGAYLPGEKEIMEVNAHLHTPYSFSAFESVRQAVDLAVAEGVKVAGINDFNTTDGYTEWAEECMKKNVFPLFNIEFIGLSRRDQEKGVLINDPQNPGRAYLSGKGLACPLKLSGKSRELFEKIKTESNSHTSQMCNRLNNHLAACDAPFRISFSEVSDSLTMGNVRERHLAKALRLKTEEYFIDAAGQKLFYKKIFGGKQMKSNLDNKAAVENEIRANLLKAGGPAFVTENPDSFPEIADLCRLITDAGGIPAYPFLGDDATGRFTDFERDLPGAVQSLKSMGIYSVEFIASRNTLPVLEKYAGYCRNEQLVVTFGTEHNTPVMEPLRVLASGKTELTPRLKEISYRGACIIAAHQYLNGTGEEGFINGSSIPRSNERNKFIKLGHAIISSVTNK